MKYEISLWSVTKIILLLTGFWTLYQIRGILLLILIAGILATLFEPYIQRLVKKGVRRPLAVFLLLLSFLFLLWIAGKLILPPLFLQIKDLSVELPEYTEKWRAFKTDTANLTIRNLLDQASDFLAVFAGNLIEKVFSFLEGIFSAITVLVLTAYLLLEGGNISKPCLRIIPSEYREKSRQTLQRIHEKLGQWFSGQLLLICIVTLLSGIALHLLEIPFAITLAILAGLLELIPILGPIFAGCAAILVGIATNVPLWKLFSIAAIYTGIQQFENAVLVPRIMQKTIGLSPIVVIVAILIGGKLMGIVGAAISIPVTAAIQVALKEWIFPEETPSGSTPTQGEIVV
jgi:predicted PurR-regulated permease PerM